jgi:predicted DNA binding protein
MTVLARASVPPSDFRLGEVVAGNADLRLEMERVVPLREEKLPYLWLNGLPGDSVADVLGGDPDVARVEILERVEGAVLVRIDWAERNHPLVCALAAVDGTCLEAVGRDRSWHLTLRFPTHQALSTFYRTCRDEDVGITVTEVHEDPEQTGERPSDLLTPAQHEALCRALELGYFSIPRENTLRDVADDLEVSDTAASQRIRRGLRNLLLHELGTAAD